MTSLPVDPLINLTNCDREPIHVPDSVQDHGFLLGLATREESESHADLRVEIASANVALALGRDIDAIPGASCAAVLGQEITARLLAENAQIGQAVRFLGSVQLPQGPYLLLTHKVNGLLIAEFEREDSTVSSDELNATIANFVASLESIQDTSALYDAVTRQVRSLTGFDRILLYSFDEEGVGTVLAESRNEVLPSLMQLRFPPSDIPSQARRLYTLNRMRIIPDVDYTPHRLHYSAATAARQPLEMTHSVLRSVSPIHRDYMRNMGTASSMSVSLVIDGRLWGMISCHNATPRTVPYQVRSGCEMLARISASQIGAHTRSAGFARTLHLKALERELLTAMAMEERYIDGLTQHPETLLALTGAHGVAIVLNNTCTLIGETPSEEQAMQISTWLFASGNAEVFSTDHLAAHLPGSEGIADHASGVLAISLSQLHQFHILWFRPEFTRTFHWAGEPEKNIEQIEGVFQVHPRNSFAAWSETVRNCSADWSKEEVEAARDLRTAMLRIVLKRAEERAAMTAELEFINRELEAFSYSVSHDLRAPFRHITGFAELLLSDEADQLSERGKRYLNTISQSAKYAGVLVDSLLNFSQIARATLEMRPLAMNELVRDVWRDVSALEVGNRQVEFLVHDLPRVQGDVTLLRQVLRNLISNAVKYTRKREKAVIEVGAIREPQRLVFWIKDNGVGFDNQYAHKLFGAFQRLHRMEDFEGTGIGLANVRRIVTRHGGQTWAEGEVDKGATLFFSLPLPGEDAAPSEV